MFGPFVPSSGRYSAEKNNIYWLCHRRAHVGLRICTNLTHVFRRFSQNREKPLLVLSRMSVRLSVLMEHLGSHWKDFNQIWYSNFYRTPVEKIQVSSKFDNNNNNNNNRHLTWASIIFMIIPLWMLLTMKYFWDISYRENQNTHLCSIPPSPPPKSCHLWDNVEKCGANRLANRDDMVRRTRIACWVIKATDTHSSYAILIATPWQLWLTQTRISLTLGVHCLSCLTRQLQLHKIQGFTVVWRHP